MIAADTSSLIAFLGGENAADTAAIASSLHESLLVLPPVVLMETLSDPYAKNIITALLEEIPLLDLNEGYWKRAAALRQTILGRGLKAKLGDTLVAQSCIDYKVTLITRNRDFRHYATHCGLKLYDA